MKIVSHKKYHRPEENLRGRDGRKVKSYGTTGRHNIVGDSKRVVEGYIEQL